MKHLCLLKDITSVVMDKTGTITKGNFKVQDAGLHLRPAGKLCDEAIKYKSKISFQRGTMITNVKSLLSVLAAGIKYNDEIEFVCEGEDEEEALAGIVLVIQNGLGE